LPSGNVVEDFCPETLPVRGGLDWKSVFGGAIFVVASITTSVPPPLAPFDRRRETSTILRLYAPTRRRRISLAEAREIALSVLAEAEKRRADFSAQEARLIAIWEVEQ
jgi:hypothetical protein